MDGRRNQKQGFNGALRPVLRGIRYLYCDQRWQSKVPDNHADLSGLLLGFCSGSVHIAPAAEMIETDTCDDSTPRKLKLRD